MKRIFRKGLTRQRGFALLLALILVTMGLLFAVVSQVSVVGQRYAHAQSTSAALVQAKEALIGYAATYRDTHPGEVFGYLPCPDTDGDGSADPTINSTPGPGNCGKAGETAVGLLPYRTLGLDALRDSTGVCLWYVVSGSYKATGLTKATPMNWDTQGMIAVQDISGTTVMTPGDINGGAAAVIIAAGTPLGGRPNRSASTFRCGQVPTEVTSYIESTINPTTTSLVRQGSSDSATNNDDVLAVTPKEIFSHIITRADFKNPVGASPPGDLNVLATQIFTALQGNIDVDLANGTAPGSAQPLSSLAITAPYVGQVGVPPSLPTNSIPANYTNYVSNWNSQYRFAVCNNLCGYCMQVGTAGPQCNGILIFGGSHTTGGPRPAQPTALTDLFENVGATGALPFVDNGVSAPTAPDNIFRGAIRYTGGSADVGYCVAPITSKPTTFTCDINSFTQQSTHSGSTSEATINTVARTVTLGNVTASSAGNGCIWFPTALPFHTALHAYFSFKIANKGEGFIFALADAARNAGGPVCGGTTSGRLLGYDGNTYPKIGLEIDTRNNSFTTDQLVSGEHYAFVYWGTSASTSDDNTHGEGTLNSHFQPLNPTSAPSTSSVQSASWASKVTTVKTTTAHGLRTGENVTITGIVPSAYNPISGGSPVAVLATVIDATHFTYPLSSNPGTYGSGGSASSADIGLSVLTTSDLHLPYPSSWPPNVDINVHVDITKNYTAPTGTYTLKAYIATSFPTCSLADFQNISGNLSDSCPTLSPGIEQDAIAIDDISGEAMSSVFAGFTSGQRATATSDESVVISNFAIRSQ